jgi:hypothetical protein
MKDELKKGGLIPKGKGDSNLILVFPGVSYVSKAIFDKYGSECIQKLSGVKEVVVTNDA